MGYQRVDVRLANNREIKDTVVLKLARLPAYSLLPSSRVYVDHSHCPCSRQLP